MKNTWRFWINPKGEINTGYYYEFKTFKVYWAFRESIRQQLTEDYTNISIGLEKYLKTIGYVQMKYDYKTGKIIKSTNTDIISTMGIMRFIYRKDNYEDIYIGLNEYEKPPTLIRPLPKNLLNIEHLNDNTKHGDDLINIVLSRYSVEEIYRDMIESNK